MSEIYDIPERLSTIVVPARHMMAVTVFPFPAISFPSGGTQMTQLNAVTLVASLWSLGWTSNLNRRVEVLEKAAAKRSKKQPARVPVPQTSVENARDRRTTIFLGVVFFTIIGLSVGVPALLLFGRLIEMSIKDGSFGEYVLGLIIVGVVILIGKLFVDHGGKPAIENGQQSETMPVNFTVTYVPASKDEDRNDTQ